MANLPVFAPTTFVEMMQFAELLAQSTMVPAAYQKNPANIVLAIMYGREVGLGVLQSLQNVAVIGGRPTMFGDAMLAVVRASPLCEDVIENLERNAENLIVAAVCEARRKGRAPVVNRFSVEDAKRAKLWGKAGPWSEYPSRMMQMRARGFALRDAFPDVLRGVISAEEAADLPHRAKDVTPEQTVAVELDAFAAASPNDAPELTDAKLAEMRPAHEVLPEVTRGRPPPPTQGEIDLGLADAPEAEEPDPASEAPEDAVIEDAHSGASVEPPETIPMIGVPRRGRNWDWAAYANELIAAASRLPRDHLGAFRVANASQINNLRVAHKEEWSRAQQELARIERGDL